MAQGKRSTGPGGLGPETLALFTAIGLFVLVVGGLWSSLSIAAKLDGRPGPGSNPISVVSDLIQGNLEWSGAATAILVIEVVLLLAIIFGAVLALRRVRTPKSRVDRSASLMGKRNDLHKITRQGAQEIANRLGTGHSGPGVFIGRTVFGDLEIFGSWEDMHVDIWGPRTGKTTSRAVPAILDAPGAVIATSNKRDIVDATRDPRSAKGPVWVFDPQEVCGEEPTWWWNPLSYVKDEVTARQLADHIVASQRVEGARTDAYFDTMATDLLAGMLLAAALGNKPITQVYLWLADQLNDEPARILSSIPGYELPAQQMQSTLSLPDKQRAGVFGTAMPKVQFMLNRKVTRWVTPQGHNDHRPQFDPHRFVREGGTLYSLSKEGIGTAGPLVAALTVAIVEAAEEYAKQCPGGRMPSPLVGVLDEAANVCRWKNLPDLYSHFGSRGIILMTILQSWAQGIECWGEQGMEKLWSSANIRVYGGGVSDAAFLERLSKLIGDYDINSNSVSYSKGERSHSRQVERHNIMEVSDLASMPPGRAVVFPSGIPATMVRTVPWMARPDAAAVKASFARHDPGASRQGQLTGAENPWINAGQRTQMNPGQRYPAPGQPVHPGQPGQPGHPGMGQPGQPGMPPPYQGGPQQPPQGQPWGR
ncbi:type IV secretory system conjugative DNA transfer family protein [Kribbella deserti]|uniref:Type IV secretory system conjugative DNA transfer family protein n=1 Tax=Kribbella deserti TaxID=1926257 RepID=A0ABV6QJU8_9ACTN